MANINNILLVIINLKRNGENITQIYYYTYLF